MSDMVVIDNLAYWEEITPFGARIAPGRMTVIVTPKDEYNGDLARLLLGLAKARSGTVRIFGQEPATLNDREGNDLRRRIGTVAAGGGLISNLKVWENLLLPSQFHCELTGESLAHAGRAALRRVGYMGADIALPGLITLMQRKQVGMARAMLRDPELIIYESLDFGLNQREYHLLLTSASAFHSEKPGRVSLFLTSDQSLPNLIPEAEVYSLTIGLQP